jgi:hypothetical protein
MMVLLILNDIRGEDMLLSPIFFGDKRRKNVWQLELKM